DFCVASGNLLWTLLFLFSCAASGGWQEPENPHTQRVSSRKAVLGLKLISQKELLECQALSITFSASI
ncbi:hypothetical protein Nmel_013997, partial [Mimus melanotis]